MGGQNNTAWSSSTWTPRAASLPFKGPVSAGAQPRVQTGPPGERLGSTPIGIPAVLPWPALLLLATLPGKVKSFCFPFLPPRVFVHARLTGTETGAGPPQGPPCVPGARAGTAKRPQLGPRGAWLRSGTTTWRAETRPLQGHRGRGRGAGAGLAARCPPGLGPGLERSPAASRGP